MARSKWCKVWLAAQLRAQKGRCHWCGRVMLLGWENRHNARACTVEHLKPKSKGGTNAPDNLMLACQGCNSKRGNGDQNPPRLKVQRAPVSEETRALRGWWLKAYNRQKAASSQ